jgi:glycosyltransferase involved in cell wall biosynthesis
MMDLLARLSQTVDITVYGTSADVGDDGEFLCGNARVVLTRARYHSGTMNKLLSLSHNFLADHRRSPFDVLHGFWAIPAGFLAVTLGRIVRRPSIVSIMGADAASVEQIDYGHLLRKRTRVPVRYAWRRATKVTTLTEFQRKQLLRFGMARADARVIPIGVDTTAFRPIVPKKESPPFHILHVANLTAVKDQPTLLRAFKRISDTVEAQLRIIGPDYLTGELQRLSEALGIGRNVEFLGRVEHMALPEHFADAHLILHTSLHEGQGIVVAEAAACGTATCGTRVGLVADLENICTLAVDVGDHEGLAKKALDLLHDTSLRKQLEQQGRGWALRHDINWTVSQFAAMYHDLSGQS